jgi:tRNA G18 (ribose-2'-O)-methylase SpoU
VLRLCWEVDLTGPTVLVVGSEARGLSEAVRDVATERAGIPMPGGAESLNAGAAAAVLLYEAVRQRRTRPA